MSLLLHRVDPTAACHACPPEDSWQFLGLESSVWLPGMLARRDLPVDRGLWSRSHRRTQQCPDPPAGQRGALIRDERLCRGAGGELPPDALRHSDCLWSQTWSSPQRPRSLKHGFPEVPLWTVELT